MNRKQKRYATEGSILDQIEALKRERDGLLKESEEMEAQIVNHQADIIRMENKGGDALMLECNGKRHEIHLLRDQIIKKNVRRGNIENSHLPRMKNALAEFNTMTLPGVTDDIRE